MQLLMLTSSGSVMGRCFQNTLPTSFAAWLIAAAVLASNRLLLFHFSSKGLPTEPLKCVLNVFCTMQLLMLTSSEKVMGRCFKNTLLTNIAAWLIAAAVLAINGFLLFDFVAKDLPTNAAARIGFLFCVAIYLVLVIYFGIGPER